MVNRAGRVAMLPALFVFSASLIGGQAQPPSQEALAAKSEQARELMAAGKYEEAIRLCRELVKALPGNPGLLLNLGLAQHMAGHEQDAASTLESVLKVQPKNLPALITLGAARLALGKVKDAVAPLEKAVALQPENQDARGMLAESLSASGRHEDAAASYRVLAEKAPEDPRAWYGLGMAYQNIATSAFEKLSKADPESPYVMALVGETRVRRRQFRSALFLFNEALKKRPDLHGVRPQIAEIYRKTGHSDWAGEEEARERALAPADCKAHPAECQFLAGKNLALVAPSAKATPESLYWQIKAANELALQALYRLGELPPSAEMHELRAEIARNQNQHLEAAKEWRAVVQMRPDDPRARQEVAVSLFMGQDYKGAIAEAEPLLKALPRSAELNFLAGDSYLRLEDPEKAVPLLETALAAEPSMLAAHASLGLALARLGRNAEAAGHLEKALELDDDGSLHYQLSRAYLASGDSAKARAMTEKYQAILKRLQEQNREANRETEIGPPR